MDATAVGFAGCQPADLDWRPDTAVPRIKSALPRPWPTCGQRRDVDFIVVETAQVAASSFAEFTARPVEIVILNIVQAIFVILQVLERAWSAVFVVRMMTFGWLPFRVVSGAPF